MVITLFLILVPSLFCNRKLLIDKKRGSEGDYSAILSLIWLKQNQQHIYKNRNQNHSCHQEIEFIQVPKPEQTKTKLLLYQILDADIQNKIVTPLSPVLNLTCPEVDNNIQKEHGIRYTVECYPFLREIIVEERYGYW